MPPLRENHFSNFGVLVCKLHTHSSPHPTWSSAWCGTSPQAALAIVITVIYFLSSSEKQDGIVHVLFLQISFSLRSLEHFPCPSVFFYNIIFRGWRVGNCFKPSALRSAPPLTAEGGNATLQLSFPRKQGGDARRHLGAARAWAWGSGLRGLGGG